MAAISSCPRGGVEDGDVVGAVHFERRCLLCQHEIEQVPGERGLGQVADLGYAIPAPRLTGPGFLGVLVEVAVLVVGAVLGEDLAPAWVGVEVMAEASAGGDLVRPGALVMHQHTAPIL